MGAKMQPEKNTNADSENSAIGDQNVARLIGQAYQPEHPDPTFVRHVEAQLLALAAEQTLTHDQSEAVRLRRFRWTMAGILSAAAMVAFVALGWHAWLPSENAAGVVLVDGGSMSTNPIDD